MGKVFRCKNSFILRTGVNLLGLSEAAESIGFRATGIRTSIHKLKEQAKLPCIIHWNQEHFVVLYRITRKKAKWYFHVADPAYGLLKYEETEFKRCWITTIQSGVEKGVAKKSATLILLRPMAQKSMITPIRAVQKLLPIILICYSISPVKQKIYKSFTPLYL